MAFILDDRVRETSTAPGTGSFTMNGAVQGAQTFASALTSDADTTWYTATNGTAWETGLLTRTSATVYARTTIFRSSNSNAAVNFSTGLVDVFLDVPASRWAAPTFTGIVTVAGGQIAFPATQNSSAGANVLDDYEEGTWTPANANVTLSVTQANYTKIGREVLLQVFVIWPANANASQAVITGVPFVAQAYAGGYITFTDNTTPMTLLIIGASSSISLFTFGAASITNANMNSKTIVANARLVTA